MQMFPKSPGSSSRSWKTTAGPSPLPELRGLILAVCVGMLLLILVGAWQVARRARTNDSLANLSGELAPAGIIGQEEVGYRLLRTIALPSAETVSFALSPDDRIYVACHKELLVLESDGRLKRKEVLEHRPEAIAVGPAFHRYPGRVYIAARDRIMVYDSEANYLQTWELKIDPLSLVAIAAGEETVYAIDAAGGQVLRIGLEGQLLGTFAGKDHERNWPGLILPSGRAGIAVAKDGTVFVANPGLRRVEVYTSDGQFQYFWGKEGAACDAFFGCCNPEKIALLSDGTVVTAEKGICRIKIHSPFGEFLTLVATSRELALLQMPTTVALALGETVLLEVAVDTKDNVFVLAPEKPIIQVFAPKTNSPQLQAESASLAPTD